MALTDRDRIETELSKISASNDPFAAAVRATRMPMLVTDPRGPDNPIVFSNEAFSKLTGYGRGEVLGKNCRFLQGAGTNQDDVTRVRNAIARRESIEIDLLNYRKDGSSFWNRLLISPVFDGDGELTYFFASQFDVSPDRRRVAELEITQSELQDEIERRMIDLSVSEARLRFILSAAYMGTWTLDLATRRLVSSRQFKANFGRNPEDTFGLEELQASLDPEDLERWNALIAQAIETREDFHIEFRIRTSDKERRWVELRGQIVPDSDDAPATIVGVSLNVTERKEAEEHRKLLARELTHRVKNSLAVAQAVFTRSIDRAASLPEAREAVVGRIQALAVAQDLLSQEGWSSTDLKTLVGKALEPFKGYDIRYAGPRVVLNGPAISSLTLALYELATNSIKYGALSVPGGSVTIAWRIDGARGETFRFHWSEMGGPAVEPPRKRGFGSNIIEKAVASDLGGEAELDFRPGGILYEIRAPNPEM